MPTIGGGINGNGGSGLVDQEGDSVPDLEGLQPPLNVVSEGFLQVNRCDKLVCSSLCGQNPVDEQSSGEQYVTRIKKFTCEGGKLSVCPSSTVIKR